MVQNRLKILRKIKRLTQQDIAKTFGVNQNTYSYWENGKVNLDNEVISKLAAFFNVSVDFLMGRNFQITIPVDKWHRSLQHDYANAKDFEKIYMEYKYGGAVFISNDEIKNPPNVYDVDGLVSFEEIGTICAGFNGLINETPTGEIVEIPLSMLKGGGKEEYFILRVQGNSMYPRILEGDRILCKRCSSVDSGDFAVVLYDGECATVKKVNFANSGNWIDLVPINPEYEIKRIEGSDLEQCRVLGKVIKLIRDL